MSLVTKAEQNGCRQQIVWHLSRLRRFQLAVAQSESLSLLRPLSHDISSDNNHHFALV